MTRSKRMKPVVKVAGERERNAARVLGECRRRLAEQEEKLRQLQVYREDYARQFQDAAGQGLGAARLQDYRSFLARLNEAIRQQQQVVEQQRAECARQQDRWRDTRTHAKALDKVVERYRSEEHRMASRREQHDSDERAARGARCRDREDEE